MLSQQSQTVLTLLCLALIFKSLVLKDSLIEAAEMRSS